METLEAPSSALVVTPHPDDAEGGCGGTIARWIQQGTRVAYVVCTDGRNGTGDVEMQPDRLAGIREEEQDRAARVLGVHDVVFLRHPDGELEDDRTFRGELVHAIRRFTPDVVLTTEPHRFNSHQHRDHRMAGHLQPHKVGTVLFWGSTEPQVFVDITESIDLKVQALVQHESQVGGRSTGHWIRQRAQEVGRMAGALYAEGFRRIDFRR